jgi:hypothetical protein
MKLKMIGSLVGCVGLVAGAAVAAECYAPHTNTPNFGAGTCVDCYTGASPDTASVRAAGMSFGSKRIGAIRNTPGGATIAYVFGYNLSGGVDTPVPACFINASVVSDGALSACSLIGDSRYSKTPAGICNSANHWFLDSHN